MGWLVVAGLAACLACGESGHPSDAAMMDRFNANRAAFERLREMITADRGLLRVSDDGTRPEPHTSIGVTRERLAEYRRLLRAAGATQIDISSDRKVVELTASTEGFVTHGSTKGWIFDSAPRRDEVVPELDSMSARGTGSGLRRIGGDWYLFFEGY